MESRSDSEPLKPWAAGVLLLAAALPAGGQTLPRDFALPVPLFAAECAWNQRAAEAVVLPESDEQILVLYRVFLGRPLVTSPARLRGRLSTASA